MKPIFGFLAASVTFEIQSVSGAQSWAGSNLFYAAGLKSAQQDALLSNLADANVKVLRVWLDGQSGTVKGTPVDAYPSLEPSTIGTYNDTVLNRLDDFMVKAKSYGIKLSISIHSFNALNGGDVYGQKYTAQGFYTSSDAMSSFQKRIAHVLSHVNPHNGKSWANSPEYIFAFEAQNEAMNTLGQDFIKVHADWQCTVAGTIKSELNNKNDILVTTGGEGWGDVSMQDAYLNCAALDVVAIHAYGQGDFATDKLKGYVSRAKAANKKLILQEWGVCYYSTAKNNECSKSTPAGNSQRGSNLQMWASQIDASGIPWMYWQILPNNDQHEGEDYEIGVTEPIWSTFKEAAKNTSTYTAAFDFSKWLS